MNTEMNEQTHNLLVKYMLGEATPDEQQLVQEWLALDNSNIIYYQQLETIWQRSRQLEATTTITEEDAWQRFQQRTTAGNHHTITTEVATTRLAKPRYRQFAAAAAVALLATGGWLLYQSGWLLSNTVTLASGNTIMTDTLPDGSVVTLNKNAAVDYHKNMTTAKGNRRIVLEGEAFFDVAPDRNKPFIITAGDVTIKVTGTSFNVKRSNHALEVIVETGSVEVTRNNETVQLSKKEKVTVTQHAHLLKQQNNSELYSYYRTRQFVCKATPLYQLVALLNEVYNANIIIGNEAIKNLPLTTTFGQQPLDQILSIIEKTFSIQVVQQKDQIILK